MIIEQLCVVAGAAVIAKMLMRLFLTLDGRK